MVIKKIKYFRINLIKEMQDLHTENYKTLLKNTKDDLNKQRGPNCYTDTVQSLSESQLILYKLIS